MNRDTTVSNVKVAHIRPEYNNLYEWCQDSINVYIGRARVVFINGTRYPHQDSSFCNPFKIGKDDNRKEVLIKYKQYLLTMINENIITVDQLLSLKGKNLGCWCAPDLCHGDILVELINQFS